MRFPESELRWVPATQRHLTLRFFDDLAEDRVEDVRAAAGSAAAYVLPFTLDLEGLGSFPPRGPAKVVWVGCGTGRDALVALAEALSLALASRGFPADPRAFSPHLTLARARNRQGSSAVAAAVRRSAVAAGPFGHVRVDSLLFIRSTLGSGPPRHDVLGAFPLAT